MSVSVDRPLGSVHPRWGYRYPVNCGEVPEYRMPDGGGLGAYLLGEDHPVDSVTATVIAVIERRDDPHAPKLVVCRGLPWPDRAQIEAAVAFQEQWFSPVLHGVDELR